MPNPVHLILVPRTATGLVDCLCLTHRRYTLAINRRHGWHGYLWQRRFASCVLDEPHLLPAARYVEHNPVRARLCRTAADWPWSSVRSHLDRRRDGLTDWRPLRRLVPDWAGFLAAAEPDPALAPPEARPAAAARGRDR